MPDPKVSLPVRVEKRGDSFVVVDANGKRVPGSRDWTNEASAREEARQVNAAWKRAKSERRAKGAPEITEALHTADALFERLHPRGRGGKWIRKLSMPGGGGAPRKPSLYTMKSARRRLEKRMERASEKEQVSVRMQLRELDRRIEAKQKVRATTAGPTLRPRMASPLTGQPLRDAMKRTAADRAKDKSGARPGEMTLTRGELDRLSDYKGGKKSPPTGEEAFQQMKATAAALGLPWDDAEMRKQMGLPSQPLPPDIAASVKPTPGQKPKLNEQIKPQVGTAASLGVEKGKYTPEVGGVKTASSSSIGSLNGKNVVVTGKLSTGTRNEVHGKIAYHGGNPQSSISSSTDLLVVGDKPGSKLAKAKAMGIPVITEQQLQELTW